MIRWSFYIVALLIGLGTSAQTALYNSGNLRIHEGGQLGFHTNLINDGTFDENLGLVGFYGIDPLTLSGALAPTFFDVELAVDSDVGIDVPINAANNVNFINGDFFMPAGRSDLYLNFLDNAFYTGETDFSHVNGYAAVAGQASFTFPIGDGQRLRPLILNSEGANPLARCAYYAENPNSPAGFSQGFDTELRPRDIAAISTVEFWHLEGSVPSTVALSWDANSNLGAITDAINNIVVVGWSKNGGRWERLGATTLTGDLEQGFVTSATFVPDDYAALTFGVGGEPTELLTLDNFFVSANGDGINDVLVIPELEQSPNNHLRIFDRFGLKVFDQPNYTNEFDGFSNVGNLVVYPDKGLPIGVYFYIVSLFDLGLEYQGFLYLSR